MGISHDDRLAEIHLPQGTSGVEYNFGERLPASLSGRVHVDLDGDCELDDHEETLSGVLIRLLDSSGNEVASTRTNSLGIYRFSGLIPGRYAVVQEQPEGYFDGHAKAGSEGGQVGNNQIRDIDLDSGASGIDYDFCEEPPASLSGSVHVDSDGDCIRDANEVGIEGVVIELRDSANRVVATTQTDPQGNYVFAGLSAGQYSVFEVQPEGYLQGGQVLGSAGGVVLGIDLMSVSLEPGQTAVDYLFCEYEPATITGSVWSDDDRDDTFDSDETPISEVTVKLIDAQGNIVRTTKTDVGGRYSFEGVEPGIYSVCQQQPDDYFHGGQLVGDRGGVVAGEDLLAEIQVGSGSVAAQYDFPELPPAMISGYVFVDGETIESSEQPTLEQLHQLRDGVFTSDDTPLSAITMELRDEFGLPLEDDAFLNGNALESSIVETDSRGYYSFKGLRPGTYTLFQTQPDDVVDFIDTPGSSGGLAVNRFAEYTASEQRWIASIDRTDSYDAILGVSVGPTMASQQNNFSELRVNVIPDVPPPPSDFLPIPELEEPQFVAEAPDEFLRRQIVYSQAQRERVMPPPLIGDFDVVTWHLSVINGGHPRGTIAQGSRFKQAAMERLQENWQGDEHSQGSWRLLTIEGELREESEAMNLGAEDAVALVGDFDGDGDDEAAIFVAGHWYVDLNGDGVWDAGDLWILLGNEMDRPVVGDWDGDGKDDIGIYGRKWEQDLYRVKLDAGLPDPSNRSRRYLETKKNAWVGIG